MISMVVCSKRRVINMTVPSRPCDQYGCLFEKACDQYDCSQKVCDQHDLIIPQRLSDQPDCLFPRSCMISLIVCSQQVV